MFIVNGILQNPIYKNAKGQVEILIDTKLSLKYLKRMSMYKATTLCK